MKCRENVKYLKEVAILSYKKYMLKSNKRLILILWCGCLNDVSLRHGAVWCLQPMIEMFPDHFHFLFTCALH